MQAFMADMPKHWLEEHKNSDASQWDETWNGVLHVPPVPNGMHQDFEHELTSYLKRRWGKPNRGLVRHQVNLTSIDDPVDWMTDYRIPDIVMVDRARLHIDKNTYMVAAPLVAIEIYSSGDESYAKLPFYATLEVTEVWVIDRDEKTVEVRALNEKGQYRLLKADNDDWLRSPATGVEFRQTQSGKVTLRINGDDATAETLPDDSP
jgi:Uma2 family endonuclease